VAGVVSGGSKTHGDVLDVGCGTGLIFSFLEKVCGERGRVNVGKGKGKVGKVKGKGVKGRDGDAVDVDFGPGLGGFEQSRLVGVDLSKEMLDIAQEAFPSSSFVQGDFLDFESEKRFDCIVFNECLHYFEDLGEAIGKAVGLCKPRGGGMEGMGMKGMEGMGMEGMGMEGMGMEGMEGMGGMVGMENGVSEVSVASKIVISHPRGMENVRRLNQHNQLMVPSLLPSEEELQRVLDIISSSLEGTSVRLATAPHLDSAHYLAVIEIA
jgi:SAM-dependent methyltransferase